MDYSKILLNFGMSILSSNLNQIISHCEEREPAASIEVLFFGAEIVSMETMVLSSYQLLTCVEFNYMTIKLTS